MMVGGGRCAATAARKAVELCFEEESISPATIKVAVLLIHVVPLCSDVALEQLLGKVLPTG